MKLTFALVAISLLGLTQAHAELRVAGPVVASTEIPQWNATFTRDAENFANDKTKGIQFTQCRETVEIKGAFLCASYSQDFMNAALARASWFIEGGTSGVKGSVITLDDPRYQSYASMVGGHDLRGQDLAGFYSAVTKQCQESNGAKNICLSPYEKEIFEKFINPTSKTVPNFVIITYAINGDMNWADVVTHEILHAQYFNDEKFRAIVDKFWATEVADSDKQSIRSRLARYYDAKDDLLMKNEFQAYVLMTNAEGQMLGFLVGKYRARLMEQMKKAGVTPVQVQE